eukprot:3986209-Alexandrium_andersonii.AAC.1
MILIIGRRDDREVGQPRGLRAGRWGCHPGVAPAFHRPVVGAPPCWGSGVSTTGPRRGASREHP